MSPHRSEETNSGRREIRTVQFQPLQPGQVSFPHAAQTVLIERYTAGRGDGKPHVIAELAVTTAPVERADARARAGCVRDRWGIESLPT